MCVIERVFSWLTGEGSCRRARSKKWRDMLRLPHMLECAHIRNEISVFSCCYPISCFLHTFYHSPSLINFTFAWHSGYVRFLTLLSLHSFSLFSLPHFLVFLSFILSIFCFSLIFILSSAYIFFLSNRSIRYFNKPWNYKRGNYGRFHVWASFGIDLVYLYRWIKGFAGLWDCI